MSEFLPESGAGTAPQTDSVGSLLTPATLDISSGDIALMQKVLAAAARNPNLIPSDFMAYIVDYIQTSRLSIPIGQVFGFTQANPLVGIINSDGTIAGGTGFSVVHNSGGHYTITFAKAFSAPPAIFTSLNAVSLGGITLMLSGAGFSGLWDGNSFCVEIQNSGQTFFDVGFTFTAQLPSS